MSLHIATVQAYPIKAELGGGYRATYRAVGAAEEARSEVLPTLDAARFWARTAAWDRHHAQFGFSLAALRRHGAYQANVWVAN